MRGYYEDARITFSTALALDGKSQQAAVGAAKALYYQGDFIGQYLAAVVYPEGLTSSAQVTLGVLLVVVNASLYTLVWRRRRRAR